MIVHVVHTLSTQEIGVCFLMQDGRLEEADREPNSFTREENEMEIMRRLTKGVMEPHFL